MIGKPSSRARDRSFSVYSPSSMRLHSTDPSCPLMRMSMSCIFYARLLRHESHFRALAAIRSSYKKLEQPAIWLWALGIPASAELVDRRLRPLLASQAATNRPEIRQHAATKHRVVDGRMNQVRLSRNRYQANWSSAEKKRPTPEASSAILPVTAFRKRSSANMPLPVLWKKELQSFS